MDLVTHSIKSMSMYTGHTEQSILMIEQYYTVSLLMKKNVMTSLFSSLIAAITIVT